jgi:hypothetical protein
MKKAPVSFLQAVLFLLAVSLGSVGCRGDIDTGDPNLALSVAISPTPPMVGEARIIISLSDSEGTPIPDALVEVEGNMSHAGMVPVFDTARGEEAGRYGISDFAFTMAGDWVLDVKATLPDGRWVRILKPANVVGVMGGGG